MRDVGLDPMQEDPESPRHWQLQFRRIQKEIIELWDVCNVSLVHRTYFYLLFKGDPADSNYMEVELRRLSFLKDTFDRGSQTVEGSRTLSAPSRYALKNQPKRLLPKITNLIGNLTNVSVDSCNGVNYYPFYQKIIVP